MTQSSLEIAVSRRSSAGAAGVALPDRLHLRSGLAPGLVWLVAVAALSGDGRVVAQTTLLTDGVIESTEGGFRFPDGSLQTTAASGSGLSCSSGDFVYCYGGPPETLDVGDCRPGIRFCEPSGSAFGVCSGEILPTAETCDGRDNDCDGAIDPGGICDGELVISEILYDSSGVPDESFEWIEVYNPTLTRSTCWVG